MFIGVDIGTTNVKAVAVREGGEVCATADRRNTMLPVQAGWSEQDPELLFQHVLSVLHEMLQQVSVLQPVEAVQGIVFSSAMHGLVAVDTEGKPLTDIWLWSDLRAGDVAQRLRKSESGVYQRTGVPIHPMSPLCKLIWLREHRPDIFRHTHKFLGIKEFVWYRLTGKFESDLSCASATGLMNIWENEWDAGALALAGITEQQLPALVSTFQLSGSFKLPESSLFGSFKLPESCTLIIGASDGALANLGSGATQSGQVSVTIGTSAAIRCVTATPAVDEAMRTFCYRLDDKRCIVGGASNNGTNVLEWLRTAVFRSPYTAEAFANQAVDVPPGADGLIFLPYILGERAPLWDAGARGSFQGLTAQHGQAHFVRAAMEGVLFNLKIIAESISLQNPVQLLYASGGFSQNTLWVQMLADIFQTPVYISKTGIDSSVLGAIQVGRAVMGLAPMEQRHQQSLVEPNPDMAPVYQAAFQRFLSYAVA